MTIVMVLSESKRNQEGCCCKIIKCHEGFVRKYCFGSVNVKLQEILIFFSNCPGVIVRYFRSL